MKKYMMLAIVPILLQSSAFAGDAAAHMQEAKNSINQAIMPQLQLAQIAMNSTISLDFDSIVPALVLFAKKARNNKPVAISNMQNIKKALELFEAQEKKKISYYSWLMGSSVLIKQIKVQIAYIDKALADLGVKKGDYPYLKIGLYSLNVLVAVGCVLWQKSQKDKKLVDDAAKPIAKKYLFEVYYFFHEPQEMSSKDPFKTWVYNDGSSSQPIDNMVREINGLFENLYYEQDRIFHNENGSSSLNVWIENINKCFIKVCQLYAVMGIDFANELNSINLIAAEYNSVTKSNAAGVKISPNQFSFMKGHAKADSNSFS